MGINWEPKRGSVHHTFVTGLSSESEAGRLAAELNAKVGIKVFAVLASIANPGKFRVEVRGEKLAQVVNISTIRDERIQGVFQKYCQASGFAPPKGGGAGVAADLKSSPSSELSETKSKGEELLAAGISGFLKPSGDVTPEGLVIINNFLDSPDAKDTEFAGYKGSGFEIVKIAKISDSEYKIFSFNHMESMDSESSVSAKKLLEMISLIRSSRTAGGGASSGPAGARGVLAPKPEGGAVRDEVKDVKAFLSSDRSYDTDFVMYKPPIGGAIVDIVKQPDGNWEISFMANGKILKDEIPSDTWNTMLAHIRER